MPKEKGAQKSSGVAEAAAVAAPLAVTAAAATAIVGAEEGLGETPIDCIDQCMDFLARDMPCANCCGGAAEEE